MLSHPVLCTLKRTKGKKENRWQANTSRLLVTRFDDPSPSLEDLLITRESIPPTLRIAGTEKLMFFRTRFLSCFFTPLCSRLNIFLFHSSSRPSRRCQRPSSPALHSFISRPHSDLRTWEAVIRRVGLGSRIE